MAKTMIAEEHDDKLREDAVLGEILGANLRRLRLSAKTPGGLKITLLRLADMTALSRISLWRFENGKTGITFATLVRLKEALGCSWDDLLDGCESGIVKDRKSLNGATRKKK